MTRIVQPDDVVITGVGVVSPFGCSVEEVARLRPAPHGASLPVSDADLVSEIPMSAVPDDKRARIGRLDRLCRFFLSASYLAVKSARLTLSSDVAAQHAAPAPERIGLSFGTGLGCLLTNAEYNRKIVEQGPGAASPRLFAYTVSSAAAGEVSIALGIKGPNVTSHMGLAAGLGAVAYGFDLIQMGKADVVLAGGADVIGPDLLNGLRDMGLLKPRAAARPFQDAVPGVYPSEAAVVVVLERRDRAQQRGAPCYARVEGYAAGFEPTLTRPQPECSGIVATLQRALALSGRQAGEIDAVLCSAHGTPTDAVERAALAEVFGAQDGGPVVLAPKAVFGDSFGASGLLAMTLAAGRFEVPDGVAFGLEGPPLATSAVAPRLAAARLVMIDALCYSGNIVDLVIAREP